MKNLVRTIGKVNLPQMKIGPGLHAKGPQDIAALAQPISNQEQEFLVVFNLKGTYEITSVTIVAIGDRNVIVCPQCQVFKSAIVEGAAGIVIVHNHPSGKLKLSKVDKHSIKQWMKIGALLEIAIVDAMVVTEERWRSYGWLAKDGKRNRKS